MPEMLKPVRFMIRKPVLGVSARQTQQYPIEGVYDQMPNPALRGRGDRVLRNHQLQQVTDLLTTVSESGLGDPTGAIPGLQALQLRHRSVQDCGHVPIVKSLST